jgi:hypothetical protein
MRPEARVSAARPAARAARGYVLPPPLRCREALLKARADKEAMLLRVRETPEINRAGSADIYFLTTWN